MYVHSMKCQNNITIEKVRSYSDFIVIHIANFHTSMLLRTMNNLNNVTFKIAKFVQATLHGHQGKLKVANCNGCRY